MSNKKKSRSIKILSKRNVKFKMIGLRKKDKAKNPEERKIKEQIKKIQGEMQKADLWFESETNDNLIEACIHQQKSLSAKLSYLLEKLKPVNS